MLIGACNPTSCPIHFLQDLNAMLVMNHIFDGNLTTEVLARRNRITSWGGHTFFIYRVDPSGRRRRRSVGGLSIGAPGTSSAIITADVQGSVNGAATSTLFLDHCSRCSRQSATPHVRQAMRLTWRPCLLDADWCLQSDAMADSRGSLMGGCDGWLLWVVAMGGCYGWLLWVDADWCLQSDAMADSRGSLMGGCYGWFNFYGWLLWVVAMGGC